MPDLFDRLAAKAPKQDLFDRLAAKKTPQQKLGLPDPAAQAKQQMMARAPGLTRDTGLYPQSMDVAGDRQAAQTKSMLSGMTGTPDASYASPEQAKTGIATGALAEGAMVAPMATAGGVAGATAGDYGLKNLASKMGASPGAAEMWGTTGGIVGGLAGGETGARVGSAASKGIMRQIAKLSGETPERLATLKSLPNEESGIAPRVVQNEAKSRAVYHAAYESAIAPVETAPVDMAGAKNIARVGQQALPQVGQTVPRVINSVEGVQNLLTNGTPQDAGSIVSAMHNFDSIPVRQAQALQLSIERYIGRGRGELPPETYNTLKSISNSIKSGIKETIGRESGEEGLARLRQADSLYKQHQADFGDVYNKDVRGMVEGPLKRFTQGNTDPSKIGDTLKKMMNPADRAQVLEALDRRDPELAQQVRDLFAKGEKPLAKNLRDAALVRGDLSAYQQQTGAANRAAAGKMAIQGAKITGAVGATGMGLYDLYKYLAKGRKPG